MIRVDAAVVVMKTHTAPLTVTPVVGKKLFLSNGPVPIGSNGLNNLTRFNIVNNTLQSVDGSQSAGGSNVIASRDGQFVFASTHKLLAKNLMTVEGTFSETILAINNDGSLAVGANHIFDGTTFTAKRVTPLSTNTMAMSADGTTLYLYDTKSSRIYVASLP